MDKYKSLRVKKDTHKRFKQLALDADRTVDEFATLIMNEYERSRAISRGFARKPIPQKAECIKNVD